MMKASIQRAGLAVCSAFLLGACANNYATFYKPVSWATADAIASVRANAPSEHPIVEHAPPPGSDATGLVNAYARRGYIPIGSSVFNSGRSESESSAIQQGIKVGADLVLVLDPHYTGSTTTAVPLTTPTTTTTYSSGTATAYGPRGVVNAYGTGTSTSYGTTTTMIPVTQQRHDFGAIYFVKQKISFGVFARNLTDAERQELQSNKGLYVRAVADNSPAFEADILAGDIILSLNGMPTSDEKTSAAVLEALSGQSVKVLIYRKGSRVEKTVQLRAN